LSDPAEKVDDDDEAGDYDEHKHHLSLIMEADFNKDGKLSKEEIIQEEFNYTNPDNKNNPHHQARENQKIFEAGWAKVDKNGDGFVTSEEMPALVELLDHIDDTEDDREEL